MVYNVRLQATTEAKQHEITNFVRLWTYWERHGVEISAGLQSNSASPRTVLNKDRPRASRPVGFVGFMVLNRRSWIFFFTGDFDDEESNKLNKLN